MCEGSNCISPLWAALCQNAKTGTPRGLKPSRSACFQAFTAFEPLVTLYFIPYDDFLH